MRKLNKAVPVKLLYFANKEKFSVPADKNIKLVINDF